MRALSFSLVALLVACSNHEQVARAAQQTDDQVAPFFTCRYRNPFSHVDECKEYRGRAFDEAAAKRACAKPFTGVTGALSRRRCRADGSIGACTENANSARMVVSFAYGGFASLYRGACEGFARGTWREDGSTPPVEPPDTLLPEARAALASDAQVQVEPACLEDACVERLVASHDALWFRPREGAPTDGLVLYPGAGVDPRAYAPIAHALARDGVLVAIVPMPGRLALAGIDRARDVMRRASEVERWFLAGHSLGGAMAARHARQSGARGLRGLVLWAAFPDREDDLSALALPVTSIFGSEDGRTTLEEVDASRALLPPTTRYVRIEGANHAQFGSYGEQEGDGLAELDGPSQRAQIAAATLHFMRSIDAEHAAPDPRFALAMARDAELCRQAQFDLVHASARDAALVESEEVLDIAAFGRRKSSIDRLARRVRNVHHVQRAGQSTLLTAPPIMPRELWCKLKSGEALREAGVLEVRGADGSCADVNRATLAWALAQLTPSERQRVKQRGSMPRVVSDRAFDTGLAWLTQGNVELGTRGDARAVELRAASLTVPANAEVAPEFRGVHYCKLLASSEALRGLLEP